MTIDIVKKDIEYIKKGVDELKKTTTEITKDSAKEHTDFRLMIADNTKDIKIIFETLVENKKEDEEVKKKVEHLNEKILLLSALLYGAVYGGQAILGKLF